MTAAAAAPKRRRQLEEEPFVGVPVGFGGSGPSQTHQKMKRQKVGLHPNGKLFCSEILDYLMELPFAKDLINPPDGSQLPMNLASVKSSLEADFYSTALVFASHVRFIFDCAAKYYPMGRPAHAAASYLSKRFETRWEQKNTALSPRPKQGKAQAEGNRRSYSRVSHSVNSTHHNDHHVATLVDHAIVSSPEMLSPSKAKPQLADHRTNRIAKLRELARCRISKMQNSVQFEHPLQDLKQLLILCGSGFDTQHIYFGLLLKNLGLYLQYEDEEAFLDEDDWEEGEIRE